MELRCGHASKRGAWTQVAVAPHDLSISMSHGQNSLSGEDVGAMEPQIKGLRLDIRAFDRLSCEREREGDFG